MVTLLPDPDSPNRQSTSPGLTVKLTPLITETELSRVTNRTVRSSTSTSGAYSAPRPTGGSSAAGLAELGATGATGGGYSRAKVSATMATPPSGGVDRVDVAGAGNTGMASNSVSAVRLE